MRGSLCRELNIEEVAATTARRPRLIMRWVRTAPFENRERPIRVVARWVQEPAVGPSKR
jgi:hypothetical protein